ncbi:exonuclease [Mesorhizobium hungaricum]|jgi:putative phage-type endonuclease|uniref:Exonuclease n=1 Tax=Mesorhizobium hungaricum TaxID=1566387 RepID=A0A1C2DS34_9HYPH|nr:MULTISPECIES: lambda exonuclease family protein [Mesorhizobium]MBN9236045.1 YqaJ viral recombinase family protein [Mesorhizobium sp.]OCX17591.1 exonuclease [Mesorhizobium hungaricum]
MDLQRTDEWFAARLGRVTASRIADVCARTKTGWGAGRKNYMAELVAERLTGTRQEGFTNAAMQWGTDQEPEARIAYEFYRDATVVETGFVPHPSIAETGASPDGLVRDDGLVEIKCPNTATHLETLLGAELPQKYFYQIQWQLSCTGRQWCDFVSYDPRLPEAMRLHVERVSREDIVIAALEKDVIDFLNELRDTVHRLKAKYEPDNADAPEVVRLMAAG